MLKVMDARCALKFLNEATETEMLLMIDNLTNKKVEELLKLLNHKITERLFMDRYDGKNQQT